MVTASDMAESVGDMVAPEYGRPAITRSGGLLRLTWCNGERAVSVSVTDECTWCSQTISCSWVEGTEQSDPFCETLLDRLAELYGE